MIYVKKKVAYKTDGGEISKLDVYLYLISINN